MGAQAETESLNSESVRSPLKQAMMVAEECSAFWQMLANESGYEKARGCVVQINMGEYYGSGVLWDLQGDRLVIASNAHLLQEGTIGKVIFRNGVIKEGTVLGLSDMRDIGFMEVEVSGLEREDWSILRLADKDVAHYQALSPGEDIFVIGSTNGVAADYYEGTVGNIACYFSEFQANMLYGYCKATAGMSGGGTFDAEGHFVGMLTAGTEDGEIASLPVETMMEEYSKLVETE